MPLCRALVPRYSLCSGNEATGLGLNAPHGIVLLNKSHAIVFSEVIVFYRQMLVDIEIVVKTIVVAVNNLHPPACGGYPQ